MPMPIAHGFLGASIVAAIMPKPFKKRFYWSLLTGAILANLADFDFLLVFATHNKEWHRGFTHSIFFALVVGLLFYFGRKRWREALAYSLSFASHFVLDFIMTKIGGGLELLFPFSDERYGLRLFGLSEYPSRMSPLEIVTALIIEFSIFGVLFLLIILMRNKFKHRISNA